MSITIAEPSVEERIRRRLESGRYADAAEVVAEALDTMEQVERRLAEDEEKVEQLRALIAEADAELERGEIVEWTPTLMSEILAEALEANRRGEPVDEHVKG